LPGSYTDFFMLLLILVLVLGKEVNGARAWFDFGAFGLQPSEFAKFATGLALASYLNSQRQCIIPGQWCQPLPSSSLPHC
jgi:cell division protein FtsW (lipid II flippase)